ncbi:1-phosphofructokinase family hexose kinase [Actinomadura xylanilytica]|uniref:1-phosphofructokinase family hexose kinase n=1 Tax=Actinomadura xylanilytica TaxID=887459 RepID=UPI00255AA753|nr:hexose kinase [Actinomadura xylanilytica]MDL4772456.1 hexose kinase [Actinomadura xylanilytica]
MAVILTVTLNAALDVTYATGEVAWGGTNRVRAVRRRAGGKGVNVARVAATLGHPVLATGLAGGSTGDLIRNDLDHAGIRHDFSSVKGTSRSTLAVVGGAETTLFNEAGPCIDAAEWDAFLDHYRSLLPEADVVVLSGSLPPGVPDDAYAVLASMATAPVIIDADGAALSAGVRERPALVKPNAEELARATGESSPVAGAQALRAAGARAVLVSLGPDGMLAVTPDGTWRATPPGPMAGNPTGAGDAAVAAAAVALTADTSAPDARPVPGAPAVRDAQAARESWTALLRHAVALSAAAVRAPVAGDYDAAAYTRLLPEIVIEGDPCPS